MKKVVCIIFLILFSSQAFTQKPIHVYNQFNDVSHLLIPNTDTTLVVNFWASWCKPCIEEMPAIEKTRLNLVDKKVKFLLISLDDPGKMDNMVLPLIKKLEIKANIILLDDTDYNSWIDKVDPSWSGALPGTLIVNKDSKQFYEQSFTYEKLMLTINKHLIR